MSENIVVDLQMTCSYAAYGQARLGEVSMVSKTEYLSIRNRILEIVGRADSSVDPSDLLRELRNDGTSRELGSTIMLEMVGAGQISRRAEDWHLTCKESNIRGTHSLA